MPDPGHSQNLVDRQLNPTSRADCGYVGQSEPAAELPKKAQPLLLMGQNGKGNGRGPSIVTENPATL